MARLCVIACILAVASAEAEAKPTLVTSELLRSTADFIYDLGDAAYSKLLSQHVEKHRGTVEAFVTEKSDLLIEKSGLKKQDVTAKIDAAKAAHADLKANAAALLAKVREPLDAAAVTAIGKFEQALPAHAGKIPKNAFDLFLFVAYMAAVFYILLKVALFTVKIPLKIMCFVCCCGCCSKSAAKDEKKAPLPPEPAAKKGEFSMTLEPQLGLNLDASNATNVIVMKVYGEGSAGCELKHGDRITGVDGERDNKVIVAKLKKGMKAEITAVHPEEFTILLNKAAGQKLGAVISQSGGRSLLVKEIKAGAFEDYNKANPAREVKSGDRIAEVNGINESSEKIMAEIANCNTISAIISRSV